MARCLAVQPERRYRDAGALVEDLDHFLHRQPLAHAINPSSREKSVNWVVRNRVGVSAVLSCLFPIAFVLGLAIGFMYTPARSVITVESSPILKSAFKTIAAGEARKAIGPLERLAEEHPESGLSRLGLWRAYYRIDREKAAASFEELLKTPNHVSELRTWREDFPDLIERLDKYAEYLNNWGADIKTHLDLSQEARDLESKRPFELAKAVKRLARILRGSTDADLGGLDDFQTALADEGLGNYDSVYTQASQVLERMQTIGSDGPISADWDALIKRERNRFEWAWLRARVATGLADRLQHGGSESDRIRALKYLEAAEKDLQGCRLFANNFEKKPLVTHWVEGIRAPAMLTMAEVEIDLENLPGAGTHLKAARHAIQTYRTLSLQIERNDPSSRRNVEENLRRWEDRLDAASARLEREKAAEKSSGASSHVSYSGRPGDAMNQLHVSLPGPSLPMPTVEADDRRTEVPRLLTRPPSTAK